jgi:probable rRNA maturation factor
MNKSASRVQFHFVFPCALPARGKLKAFLVSIFKKEKRTLAGLSIIFCDDRTLLRLNLEFLKHDYYTDILSFPLVGPHKPLLAEIYISVQRVKENAVNLETSFREELHRVIFHGVLHFCGFKDKTQADKRQMRNMEDKYLGLYFKSIARPAANKRRQ